MGITREEAIKWFRENPFYHKDHEPFNMAIKALEQELTTKKDCNTCTHSNETDGSNCYECVKDMCNNYEPTTKNCESCRYYGSHHDVCNYCYKCSLWTEQEPTTKNDLGVDGCIHKCIDKPTTFKDDNAVSRLSVRDIIYANAYELEYPDGSSEYVVNRDELIKYLMELPSVTPQEPTDNDVVLTYDMYHDLIADRAEKLEQELILDKIRAEIEQYQSDAFYSEDVMMNKRTVLQILDKYKSLEQGTCKNCKYWQKSARTWGGLMYCALLSGEYMIDTEEDFYCADYKDRREE